MSENTQELCDLCRSPALEKIYQPQGSTRGISIHLCTHCGLIQSLPRIDRAPRRAAAVSGGADWGNVRYGKGFRTDACLWTIQKFVDFRMSFDALDVGSNRGSFAKSFLDAAPYARLVALEPDERVVDSCKNLDRTTLVPTRIEESHFPDNSFDLIHSCHTIEHLASPAATLADHWRTLRPGGLLLVDAPNVALIGGDDILEEWFIDKHLYHFSNATLTNLFEASGFDIVETPDPRDKVNLLIAAKKRMTATRPVRANEGEANEARSLMADYIANRARNLSALAFVAAEMNRMRPKKVAIWGAGRLFDMLVKHGGFDPKSLSMLIDSHLIKYMNERHGMALSAPEALAQTPPDVIVVMSRSFAEEISRLAARYAPKAEVIFYADILSRARLSLAA